MRLLHGLNIYGGHSLFVKGLEEIQIFKVSLCNVSKKENIAIVIYASVQRDKSN